MKNAKKKRNIVSIKFQIDVYVKDCSTMSQRNDTSYQVSFHFIHDIIYYFFLIFDEQQKKNKVIRNVMHKHNTFIM